VAQNRNHCELRSLGGKFFLKTKNTPKGIFFVEGVLFDLYLNLSLYIKIRARYSLIDQNLST
jgi:hypothetical protein